MHGGPPGNTQVGRLPRERRASTSILFDAAVLLDTAKIAGGELGAFLVAQERDETVEHDVLFWRADDFDREIDRLA